MKLHARTVLDDCRGALDDLDDKYKVMGSLWRRRWVAALSLLRAVGHVLDKIDGQDPQLRSIIDASWSTKKRETIFSDFVKQERNQILKEYAPSAGQSVTVRMGDPVDSVISYNMNNGSYAGRDPRDVVAEAIEWWDSYLDEIDDQATS